MARFEQKARNERTARKIELIRPVVEAANFVATTEQKLVIDSKAPRLIVFGGPGTGKTATVREVLRSLNSQSGDCGGQDGLPAFDVLEINGMTVTDPNYTYTLLWERLSGRKLPSAQAQQLLDEYFNPESSAAARRQRRPSSRKMW